MAALENPRTARSVLLVEDDRDALQIIGALVAKKFPDLAIRTAGNGRQGVELCRELMPDIVVTDINMSGMDGLQMAGEIKKLRRDMRFIVLTGYSDKEHLYKFKEIGAIDYIVKPVNFKKLFIAIEKCLDQIRQEGAQADGC